MSWSDEMEDDAELEEGEAPYYMDDRSFDPETALSSLSYLDEKLQNVLGHFQKDFEGGVSAENLGPKFGGYGSFLPTCQRSPPIRSQPKSPRVQSVLTSPNHVRREGTSQSYAAIPDAQISQRNGTTASYIRQSSVETKVSLGDGPFKKNSSLSSAQAAEKVPLRLEPSPNKSMNPTDQRKLKFRIRVSCDKVAPKNAEIYNGLGLISPSSSTGNSPGESAGIPFDSQETPDKSPGILEMLTTFTGAGASLLSPLQDNFLNLFQKSSLPPLRVKHEHSGLSVDDSGSRPHGGDGFAGKQPKAIRKIEILKESEGGTVGSEDNITFRLKDNSGAETPQKKQSISFDTTDKRVSDSLANTGESSRDSFRVLEVVREPENGEKIRKREVRKDKAKGKTVGADLVEPFESMAVQGGIKFGHHEAKSGSVEKTGKNLMKGSWDLSLDQSEDKRIKGNRIPASIRGDSDFSESDSRGPSDNLVKKSHLRPASLEQDELCMAEMTNKLESKKKSRVSQVNNVKLYSDSVQESGRVGSSLAAKEKKGIKKGVNKVRNTYKDIFETNMEPSVRPTDMLEKPSSDRLKDPKFDTVKEKNVHADKFKEKSSYHRSDNQLNPEKLAKNPPPGSVPPVDGPPLLSEQAIVAPVLIEEDWVCCDRCQKWRLLPYGTKPEQLPEKWLCSMLNWLPGMNRCDISEEETTKALHSLYQIPPENQNGAQYQPERTAPGMNSVDQFNFNYQNIVSDYMTDGRKKQHKLNETSNKGSKAGLGPGAKNLQLDAVKKEALNDMKQFNMGVNPVKKSSGQHLSKSDISKHSNRQKQEHVPGGNANLKRKIKRESDQLGNGNTKRFKSEGILNNSQASGENLGRMGVGSNSDLPTMAPVKEKQRTSESGYSKDSKAGEENGLQHSARKRADLGGTVSLDLKKYNEGETSAKRRNLKNWQNSPSNLEAVRSDGSYLNNNSMSVKEESSDSEFRRNKRPRMSQNDGKDFRINVPNNENRRKDMMNRPLSSGGKENTISRVHDKEKQLKKYRIKIASQLTMEDLESLKRDLGSEPLSTTATSSSSKVSDSRKSRTNYQGVKGSPVESVSSSPVRMSKTIKNSPRVDICGSDDVRQGDFSIKSPRKMVDGKKGSSTKKKGCDVLHPEALDDPVPETGGRDKFGGKSGAGPKASAFGNDHLYDNHLGMSEHGPCPTDLRASESCYSKGIGNKNQHFNGMSLKPKSAKSSLPPKDNRRASGINCEGTSGKVSDLPNNRGISNSNQTWTDNADTDQSHVTPFGEVTDNVKHSFPSRSGLKSIKNHKNVVKMDSRKCGDHTRKNQLKCGELESTATKQGNPCTVDTTIQQNLNQGFHAQISCREGNMQIDKHSKDKLDIPTSGKLAPGTQDGVLLSIRPYDIPVVADVSKETKDHQNAIENGESHHGITHSATDCSVRDIVGPSLVRRDASGQAASLLLKEAEELRDYADRLKDSGFDYECNEAYFQAALRFLHGASLLESNESGKLGEMNQIQIYINTAKLCETLAQEYEKVAQMAAAALAYKCMEVAYMRVVYCKNSSTNRLWHDLQTSLQMAPQGESPSSSASDIDNLNNQALVDKSSLSKSNGTHYGSNIIASRNRPNFARLFDFTKDVNSAMEASRKSHVAFSAANAILEEAQNKEGIISVKRVIDFSFQDVEELVRLVRIAVEAISRQRFSGSRD